MGLRTEDAPFTTKPYREPSALSPRFARASRIHGRLREAALANDPRPQIAALVLDALESPLCVVDAARRLVYANATGDELLRRGDALAVLRDGCLKPCCRRCDAALQTAIGDALEGRSGGVQLLDRNGEPALNVASLRLRAHAVERDPGTAARVLLLMTAAHRRCAPPEGMLQRMFSLTRAEASLASALARGQSADEYASQSHRSLATIRTQLRALYAKTGASRLGELLLLLGRLPQVEG